MGNTGTMGTLGTMENEKKTSTRTLMKVEKCLLELWKHWKIEKLRYKL